MPKEGQARRVRPLRGGLAARLSRYLLVLTQAKAAGHVRISSNELGRHARANPSQVRRDLSRFGTFGRRGVGYEVERLRTEVQAILTRGRRKRLLLVGAGPLGELIAGSTLLRESGFELAAVVDPEAMPGEPVGNLFLADYGRLREIVAEKRIEAALIACSPQSAQRVADDLVEAGVEVIVNASEGLVHLPEEGSALYPCNPVGEIATLLRVHVTRSH